MVENVKIIIGENIAELRKRKNLTQQDLANCLSYSDKSISKWERGESTPDIEILIKIAEIFEVDIEYLINTHTEEEKSELIKTEKKVNSYKIIISLISCVTIWFLAIVLYSIFLSISKKNLWIIFIWAIPSTFCLLLIFASVWAKPKWIFTSLSLLIWSFLTAFYLNILLYTSANIWYSFIIGVPLQIAVILASFLTKKKK